MKLHLRACWAQPLAALLGVAIGVIVLYVARLQVPNLPVQLAVATTALGAAGAAAAVAWGAVASPPAPIAHHAARHRSPLVVPQLIAAIVGAYMALLPIALIAGTAGTLALQLALCLGIAGIGAALAGPIGGLAPVVWAASVPLAGRPLPMPWLPLYDAAVTPAEVASAALLVTVGATALASPRLAHRQGR